MASSSASRSLARDVGRRRLHREPGGLDGFGEMAVTEQRAGGLLGFRHRAGSFRFHGGGGRHLPGRSGLGDVGDEPERRRHVVELVMRLQMDDAAEHAGAVRAFGAR